MEALPVVRDEALPFGTASSDELSIDDYVALRIEVDAAADPVAVLAARDLDTATYATLRERWLERCLEDGDLTTKLAERMRKKRENS